MLLAPLKRKPQADNGPRPDAQRPAATEQPPAAET
jgi:hypothetical protein